MKNLVETYISQSPGSLAQVESARKAFKAELKNGPTKTVNYANGYSGQKAFGNFDLQLFHQAYDAELDAQGLLVHFDDHGLVNRNSYQAFKAATGECAKYAKELWVLQYGKSDYKLTNVPASSIPLTPEWILQKLIKDDTLLNIFRYTVDNITFTKGEYKICHDVFTDWLGTPEKLQQFLTATWLDKAPYETVKANICSMLLCIVATGQVLRQAKATNRQFADRKGEATSLEKIVIDFNCIYRIPVRIAFSFTSTRGASWPYITMAFRFLLNADDKLLDLPVYTAAGYNNIEMPQNRIPSKGAVEVPSVTKFSDLTFTVIDQITGTYF